MSIHKKLFEIQKNIGKLTKDTSNPFYKSKYADINQLIELTNPLFHEAGLMVLQPITGNTLKTQIFDVETNEVIESSLDLPQGNDPQKIGSAITYYRRYTLKALLNLQEEDDDGNKGASKMPTEATEPEDKKPWMTETQFNTYLALINKGETWMVRLNKKLNMKKVYRETLQKAETNYKPKT